MSITAITMPKWGLTMTEGKVVGWLKAEGEPFAKGDELLEIETSKITNVMEAEAEGTLARIVAAEGSTLPIGGLLAVVAPAGTPSAEIDAFVSGFVVPEPAAEAEAGSEAAPEPKDVQAGGRRLRYLEMGGDQALVLLLHGFGADLNSWMFTQPALADLHRTIALDLPGHGGSQKDVGAGDLDAFADAVIAAMDALSLSGVNLIGHSMGGAIAAAVASKVPERVASLTMIAPAGLSDTINSAFIDGFVRATRRKDAEAVLKLLVHDPALVSRTMIEDVLRYKRIDGVAVALATIARAWFPDGRQAMDVASLISGLKLPVQIIWGRNDQIVPLADAQAMAGRLPLHVLEDTGHLPHMERSATVTKMIRDFIGV